MGKKTYLIVPWSLCGLLVMVIVVMVVRPNYVDTQLKQVGANGHNKLVKREEDDAGSYTHYGGGAIYIRWGRQSCPEPDTKLVYHGSAAGGHPTHTGAPANLLCMPTTPTWGNFVDDYHKVKGSQSYLYGVEYKTDSNDFPFSHENAEALLNHNLPCAVCMSSIRSTQLMVPAKKDCLPGWHLEYSGYLMAGDYSAKGSSEYVCVDKDPEADPAGFRVESSHLLSVVEATCGSLPCPHYIKGREVTCSVCTK